MGFSPEWRHALRSDEAVVLVLDLKNIVVELPVLPVHLHTDGPELRAGCLDGTGETLDVGIDAIVGDAQARLAVVLVTDVAHAQGGRIGLVPAAAIEILKSIGMLAEKALAHHRRASEQVGDQPTLALEVANEREIAVGNETLQWFLVAQQRLQNRPQLLGEGVVEVHAGDGLHQSSVTMTETTAVDVLHGAHVRAAVLGQRYAGVTGDLAGHAGGPQQFVVEIGVHEAVDVVHAAECVAHVGVGRRDEFQQRL